MCRNRTDGQEGSQYNGLLFYVDSWKFLGNGTTVKEIQFELLNGPVAAGMCVNKAWEALNSTRRGHVLAAIQGSTCHRVNHDVVSEVRGDISRANTFVSTQHIRF